MRERVEHSPDPVRLGGASHVLRERLQAFRTEQTAEIQRSARQLASRRATIATRLTDVLVDA